MIAKRFNAVVAFLLVSLSLNAILLVKWRWAEEEAFIAGYAFRAAAAAQMIKPGMTREEATSIVGEKHDEEHKSDHGHYVSWTPTLRYPLLHRLRYGRDIVNGTYSMGIKINEEGKVIEVLSGF
ncbi:MAG: hypothetical protein WBC19_15325 [Pyrinomonadaceae bacterium]|nr:hypothetical protein [Chloracidobacterium sp.]